MQVDVALQRVKFLKPKTDNFMKFGPMPELLICLFGDMSCEFQGTPFSFGVEIWLPKTFPLQAPMFYVVPGQEKRLRASQLVDQTGRVNHSYLAYWQSRPNASLIEMMNSMHQSFCQEPPVFIDNNPAPPVRPAASPGPSKSEAPRSKYAGMSIAQLRDQVRQKLNTRYRELQQQINIDTDRILAENTLLNEGEQKIKKGLGKLREELLRVSDEVQQAQAKNESLEEQILKLQAGDEIDIDKLVIPQGAISKQVFRELIEDLSLQDTIYAASKAFEKGRLDLATYIRISRDLAKKQFMSKAILIKIKEACPTY